ncbi:glutathione-S-transferase/glutaredoxin [Trypanosoma conorhini]|uniref:Glutathione-S-transferase/glutaredoxin n=1 Tax=Trypanosoma conorhini TaxID=83891 RepID=A0A422NKN5_9TRYP|nr:glutathione-S-transferase/glutaredoxin [Trypanosoma conorhini]RNF06060.1 glutathione-S-transferase/glutaredoxin [Trypanosoma conorhini]
MRWGGRRAALALVGGGALTGAALWYAARGAAAGAAPPPQLSADEFNALQSEALLAEAFDGNHLPWRRSGGGGSRDFGLTLYRLLGCPYCAKVEWVLRYHAVPLTLVDVDTLSGAGLPDPRYSLVPQIRLAPLADAAGATPADAAGVYVVDSQCIISAISVPLGFAGQLKDPRIAETRRWIMERFQAVSFVACNNTWRNAFASYPYVTPSRYHNVAFRVVGATGLCILSRYKILPRLVAKGVDTRGGLPAKDPAAWLQEELAAFTARLQDRPSRRFHGGREPDVADVEMYAVTRVVEAHPRLRHVLHQGALGEWNSAMEEEMRKRTQPQA